MNLFEKLNKLDDSLVESRRVIKKKKLTEGYRVAPEISKFNVGDRVAERYNDSEFNVGTIVEIKKDAEGTQYLVKWDFSDREYEEWLYGDVLSLWVEDETEGAYEDDIDEMLTESEEKTRIEVMFEPYTRYGYEPIKTGRVSGKNLLDALLKMADKMRLYFDGDYADEYEEGHGVKLTAETLLERIEEENGDGCDFIFYIKNLTTGEMLFDSEYEESENWDDDIDEMLTESAEQYELSTLVKDSINHLVNDLGKDPMADDFGDDVCADLENNYDIDVPQEPIRYADWCSAVMCEVSRQLNNKEELTEDSNGVSSQLPENVDAFLQDLAQMYGMIDYKDIMKHKYTEEEIKKLRNYERRFNAEIEYEGDKEADAIMRDIAEKVAKLVKN